jgi:DNA polymerase-3 subunit gamma/tau
LTAGTPHQALYRRWRAQTFSEIVGQDAVVATLRNAVTTGRVSHAILFTGPRGTGKTSLARIVAKAVNCLDLRPNGDPCDTCGPCTSIREGTTLDLVEIDAASNRGIEAIRDLRERLNYPPGELRRKVYILDEAHQITKDAWNALLKSLEEPPAFVLFMFASTHPQEFPPAILSRLQRFDVRRLAVDEIIGKLERILAADGRDADPEAVRLVARLASGGMRDAESILDQLLASTGGRIEAAAVRDLLGLADAEAVATFVRAMAAGDPAAGIGTLDRLEERGRDLRVFLDQVVDLLRERLVAGLGSGRPVDPALGAIARRLAAIDPTRLGPGGLRLQLELALLEPMEPAAAAVSSPAGATAFPAAVEPAPREPIRSVPRSATTAPADATADTAATPEATAAPAAPAEPTAPTASSASAAATPVVTTTPSGRAKPERAAPAAEPPTTPVASPPADAADRAPVAAEPGRPGSDLDRIRGGWGALVGSAAPALKAVLVECRPVSVEGNVITLGFPEEKPFMQGHAERSRARLESHFGGFLGHDVAIRCVTSNLDLLPPLPDDVDAAHILAEAHRIFADDLANVPDVS